MPLQGKAAWAVGIAAFLLVGVVAAVWAGREPAKGYVLIDVPKAARAVARLSLNGKAVPGPLTWPVLRQLPVGHAMVMVSADGFRPFVAPVEVAEGDQPTPVHATLSPNETRARLVVDTDPLGAEIRVDGTLVRPEGQTVFRPTLIPLGRAVRLEVSARGFEPFRGEVTATDPGAALTQSVKLRPLGLLLEVSSMPAGAEVLLGGRSLGTTPAKLEVAAGTKTVTVRKRCYAEKTLAVPPPAAPGAAVSLHADLERSPGCR